MSNPGSAAVRSPRRLLVPYLGYGTPSEIQIPGRVLRNNGITAARDSDPIWLNVRNMIKRYSYQGIPNVSVRARFQDLWQEVLTDPKGYFDLRFNLATPLEGQDAWFDVELNLLDYPAQPLDADVHSPIVGKVLIPSDAAQFGVVSDIDDTVLRTDILHIFRALSNTFFRNARTRLPFEGVAAFYDALRVGTVQGASNPIYYVSSSPWNLYDLIVDFFVIRGIPIGPLFLTELGFTRGRYHLPNTYQHKIGVIQKLFDTYPKLPFILIGDSGQKDAEIYHDLARRNPGRIRTIYLRDVTGRRRDRQIRSLMTRVSALGAEMVFSADTLAASSHALEHGYILPHKLPEVAEEREKDKQAPTLVQQLLNPETSETTTG